MTMRFTSATWWLVFLLYFLFIICQHPIRKRMYFTLAFAELAVIYGGLYLLYHHRWMEFAMFDGFLTSLLAMAAGEERRRAEENEFYSAIQLTAIKWKHQK